MRNDSEQDVPAQRAIQFYRRVTLEDTLILESTLPELAVMGDEKPQQGARAHRAQMMARRKLLLAGIFSFHAPPLQPKARPSNRTYQDRFTADGTER